MIRTLYRLFRDPEATAAVETAIVVPLFLILMLGVTDIGSGVSSRISVNAAAQAGAMYAVTNYSRTCFSLTSTCLTGIETAMDQAVNNSSYCTKPGNCVVTFACSDGSAQCVSVTANATLSPLLPDALYSWATATGITSTVIYRTQ